MTRRPLSDRIAEARDRTPRPVNYERIEPQAWGPSTAPVSAVRLLRGRVLVEPLEAAESSLIVVVKLGRDQDKTLARGRVVAMGPPMLTKRGHEVPHGFEVGDVVLHVGQHRSRDVELTQWVCEYCGREVEAAIAHADPEAVKCYGTKERPGCGTVEARSLIKKYRSVAQEEVQAVVEGDVESIDTSHGGAPDYREVLR